MGAEKKCCSLSATMWLDEKEKKEWAPEKAPFENEEYPVALKAGKWAFLMKNEEYSLDGLWQMAEGGEKEERTNCKKIWKDSIDANIPCSVHTALMNAGKIPDPLIGKNDTTAREKSYKEWWFKKSFSLKEDETFDELFFYGVCYQADFWMNGIYLGEHRGMFSEFSFDVSTIIRKENELVVRIANAPEEQNPMSPYMDNDDGWKKGTVINCVYGWHYACIPSRGIWKSVVLKKRKRGVWAESPFIMTENAEKGRIHICIRLHDAVGNEKIRGNILPENFVGDSWSFQYVSSKAGREVELNLTVNIPDPQLWWPLNIGSQNLYRLQLSLQPQAGTEQTFDTTFALRTIRMEGACGQEWEQYKWMFIINERPVFIKGSNWCTTDVLLRFPEERYERFLLLAACANIQLLRAWGGGMPENDTFYRLCDKLGIMVIQEWPTCWDSQKEQPISELEETVRCHMLRLRNHPSLVMWCGGNESKEADGEAMEMMGRLAYELDGSRPFHRTEPWGGSLHDYTTYWDMGDLDYSLGLKSVFLGEFGMASSPNFESVMRYLPEEEKNIWPPERFGSFGHHTPRFNQLDPDDMAHMENSAVLFSRLDNLEHFIWATQMAQATGVRHTLEAYRCRFPHAAGVCYYKLTDVYPACSWSTIDYYGVPKLSYYILADSYEPLHACLLFDSIRIAEDWKAPVYLLDDAQTAQGKNIRAEICAYNDRLEIIKKQKYSVLSKKEQVKQLGEFVLEKETRAADGLVLISVKLFINEVLNDGTFYWLNFHKKQGCLLQLPDTKLEWKVENETINICNCGEFPTVGIMIECPAEAEKFWVEDNMLWLDAGESRIIKLNKTTGIRVRAFNFRGNS